MSTSNYYPGLNEPSTSSGYYGSNYNRNYYPDTSSDEGVPNSRYLRPNVMHHSYYETAFLPPTSSQYSHYYPPTASTPNPGHPSAQGNQMAWYQSPMANQHDQMINMLHFSNSNGREARNRAEKQRRDKLNGSIQQLSTMVPHVAESSRRVDKTAVLRFSAHGLRIHYVFGKTMNTSQNAVSALPDSLMRLLDSFFLTITCRGQVVLVSPSVEQHLGHCQTDLFGQNILQITHPDDHAMLKNQIIPKNLESLFDVQPEDESGEPRPRTQAEEDEIDKKLREDRRVFTVRLARAGPRSEPTTYEIVKIDGCFRRADSAPRGVRASTCPTGLQLIRRARGRDDSIPLHTISGNDIVLVAVARVIKPPKVCDRLLEANHYEYRTRHLIDGRIIQCDQRISLVAGYMTEEVHGLSPFTFMHQDDVRWVIVALRQMYDFNMPCGESCYRLITRTGDFVYLSTRGYLEINKETNKVHSFVCINTLINEEEGKKRVLEMKKKFSIIVNLQIPSSEIDAPAADNPVQLERAINYLVQNLENKNQIGDEQESHHDNNDGSDSDNRHTKSPPLSIIPPKTCSIKSSISKSVKVVNVTAAKNFHRLHSTKSKSPSLSSYESEDNETPANTSRSNVILKAYPTPEGSYSADTEKPTNQEDFSNVAIKKEVDSDDSRVPPLPNSRGYFEVTSFTSTTMSSPIKPLSPEVSEFSEQSPPRPSFALKRPRTMQEVAASSFAKRRNIHALMEELNNREEDLPLALQNTFVDLDRSLQNIESATSELKGQCSTFPVNPSSQHQLNEIIEETQDQRVMLENIQSRFQARLNNSGSALSNTTESRPFHNKNELKPR